MNYETVIYGKEHGMAIVTLHRPDHGNSINEQMIKELHAVLNEAESDEEVRVLIITGEDRFFCSGVDLKEPHLPGATERRNRLYSRIEKFEKPTIAAINGYALGGGCELALCCDLRVAAEDARIGTPEVKLGIIPSGGATLRMTRLIGLGRAKEMLLLGEPITGKEGLRFGLVNRTCAAGLALEEAKKLGHDLMERPPLSLKAIKDCVYIGLQTDTESAIAFITRAADLLRDTEDYREGHKAFQERRKPIWKGK